MLINETTTFAVESIADTPLGVSSKFAVAEDTYISLDKLQIAYDCPVQSLRNMTNMAEISHFLLKIDTQH